jgi:hypothetical protein
MAKPNPFRSISVTTQSVRTKYPYYAGSAHPDTRYVVWSPDSTTGVREFASFYRARTVAHSLSEKHPDRVYRVFKSCWGRSPKAEVTPMVVTTAECGEVTP